MASVSIVGSSNNIEITLDPSGCSSVVYTSYKLYQNGSLYTSFNTTANYYTFQDVPVGFNYYVIADIYISGPTLCQYPTSNTITISSFCIPNGQTNVRFSDLATFYGLTPIDITLSGSSNPSSGSNIFGKSALPSSGAISKTRQNAVSELRNSCGGGIDIYGTPVVGDSYFRYYGQIVEDLSCGFKKDSSSGLFHYLNPTNGSGNHVYCGNFDNQREEIGQSNGVTGVESVGAKTIKIGFGTLNLLYQLNGSITVKRISDNATLASATISRAAGTNLYTNVYTLSWTNASSGIKIAVIVNATQNCVV